MNFSQILSASLITLSSAAARAVAKHGLVVAEDAYLVAHGWKPSFVFDAEKGGYRTLWTSPVGYRKEHVAVERTHAVNSQRVTARLDAQAAEPAPTPAAAPASASDGKKPRGPRKATEPAPTSETTPKAA
jgi:hypothetical protein